MKHFGRIKVISRKFKEVKKNAHMLEHACGAQIANRQA